MIERLHLLAFAALLAIVPQHVLANHHAEPTAEEQVSVGAGIYDDRCAKCHGFTLAGPEVPENFSKANMPPRLDGKGHASHHDDQELFDKISNGTVDRNGKPVKDKMPAFEKVLKPDEIWAVIAFIRSTWPQPKQPKHRN